MSDPAATGGGSAGGSSELEPLQSLKARVIAAGDAASAFAQDSPEDAESRAWLDRLTRLVDAHGAEAAFAPLLIVEPVAGPRPPLDIDALRRLAGDKIRDPMRAEATRRAIALVDALRVWAHPAHLALATDEPERPFSSILALEAADAWQVLAWALRDEEAREAYRRAVSLYDETRRAAQDALKSEDPHPEAARLLRFATSNLAHCYASIGRYFHDVDSMNRAIAIYDDLKAQATADEHPFYANTLLGRSSVELQRAGVTGRREDYEVALRTAEDAISAFRANDDPKGAARMQNNVAIILRNIGEILGEPSYLDKAIEALDAGLAETDAESELREWKRLLDNKASILNTYGGTFDAPDRLEDAIEAAERALARLDPEANAQAYWHTRAIRADSLRCLGEIRKSQEVLRRARADAAEIVAASESAERSHDWARHLMMLANVERFLGMVEFDPEILTRSAERLAEAASVFEARGDVVRLAKARANRVLALLDKAIIFDADEELEGEDAAIRDSLAACADAQDANAQNADAQDTVLSARLRFLLGLVETRRAETRSGAERRTLAASAAALLEESLGMFDHAIGFRLEILTTLARANALIGTAAAGAAAERALERARDDTIAAVASAGSPLEQQKLLNHITGVADLLALLRAERGDASGALEAVLSGRAVLATTAALINRFILEAGSETPLEKARRAWIASVRRLDAVAERRRAAQEAAQDAAPTRAGDAEAGWEIERRAAADARDRARAALMDAMAAAGLSDQSAQPTLAALREALAPGGRLVTILATPIGGGFLIITSRDEPDGAAAPLFAPAPQLTSRAAEAIARDWEIGMKRFAGAGLFPSARAVARWNAVIEDVCERVGALAMQPLTRALGLLDSGAPEPGADAEEEADARDLALLAPGVLAATPLAAAFASAEAPAVRGRRRRVLDDWRLSLFPSAAGFIAQSKTKSALEGAAPELLALTSLEADAAIAGAGASNPAWAAYDAERRSVVNGAKPAAAVAEALATGVSKAGAADLCLYAHGVWRAGEPERSGLLMADGSLLSVPEIERLPLQSARLVVIAACESARIDLGRAPDEQMGLATGFLNAGACGVVSSLWRVDRRARRH
ncbi:MAG: CHAT domain-containing protein, partial [Pseudomonadota bacterium]